MARPDNVVTLADVFVRFDDRWAPKIIGQINDLHLKAVKIEGEFVWHTHDDTDEFFLVHRGRMTIQLRGRDDVVLEAGDFYVVPKGVEHRPVAEAACEVLLLEPAGVVNTGDAETSDLTADVDWI